MKLVRCHIDNFGKLSNLDMEFSDGLNVINQPNAWGKSTLAAFLKAMFYGFDSKKEAKAVAKDRDLYRPWQGGNYGGELVFEAKNKLYKVTRSFGKSEKGDSYHLYDATTNLENHDFSSNLGGELFDLDGASFKRSIYIAQNDCVSESSDAINAKLGNLVENTNDINNFESAVKAMKDQLNALSPDRATGSIKKRKGYITQLEQEIKGFSSAEGAIEELTNQLSVKQNQKKEMLEYRQGYAQALKIASENSRRKELRERYLALQKDCEEKKAQLNQYQQVFPNEVPSEELLASKIKEARVYEEQQTTTANFNLNQDEIDRYEKLSSMFDKATPTEEQIDSHLDKLSKLTKVHKDIAELESKMDYTNAMMERMELEFKPKKTSKKFPMILGTIFEVLGVGVAISSFFLPEEWGLFPLLPIVGIGLVLLGIVILIVAGVSESKARKYNASHDTDMEQYRQPVDDLKKKMDELSDTVKKQQESTRNFLEQFHVFTAADNFQPKLYELKNQLQEYNRLTERILRLKGAKDSTKELKDKISSFGDEFGISLGDELSSELSLLQTKAAEYRLAKKGYETAKERLDAFEQSNDVEEMKQVLNCPYSLDELNDMINKIDTKVDEIRGIIEQMTHQLENLQEQLDMREEKEQELRANKDIQQQEQQKYDIINLTQRYLTTAKEQFTARYMAPISNGFEKYLQLLDSEENLTWQVDANIEVKVKEEGELRETKYLSAGYQDLIGVCMRLALVDAMYQEEKPFLILDDPFVNLDDQKLSHGKELMQSLQQEYQTIYFTCHESRQF